MGFPTTTSTFSLLSEIAKLPLNARARASTRVRIFIRVLIVEGRVPIGLKVFLTNNLVHMMVWVQA